MLRNQSKTHGKQQNQFSGSIGIVFLMHSKAAKQYSFKQKKKRLHKIVKKNKEQT
jgi:hypothetical protein